MKLGTECVCSEVWDERVLCSAVTVLQCTCHMCIVYKFSIVYSIVYSIEISHTVYD